MLILASAFTIYLSTKATYYRFPSIFFGVVSSNNMFVCLSVYFYFIFDISFFFVCLLCFYLYIHIYTYIYTYKGYFINLSFHIIIRIYSYIYMCLFIHPFFHSIYLSFYSFTNQFDTISLCSLNLFQQVVLYPSLSQLI